MKDKILTEEELEMLRNLTVTTSSQTDPIDISSPEFRALLLKAKKIRLEILFPQHHLSFPIDAELFKQFVSLPLGVPDIYEVATKYYRHWRLQKPEHLSLMDKYHIPLPFEIINISPRGLFVSSEQDILSINQNFRAILKMEDELINIEGTVIRRQQKADKGFGWAIALHLSSEAYAKLQSYIFAVHNARMNEGDESYEI